MGGLPRLLHALGGLPWTQRQLRAEKILFLDYKKVTLIALFC